MTCTNFTTLKMVFCLFASSHFKKKETKWPKLYVTQKPLPLCPIFCSLNCRFLGAHPLRCQKTQALNLVCKLLRYRTIDKWYLKVPFSLPEKRGQSYLRELWWWFHMMWGISECQKHSGPPTFTISSYCLMSALGFYFESFIPKLAQGKGLINIR